MADGNSLGADTQKRAWAFIYALLISPENCEGNPDDGEIRIVRENWSDGRKNGYPTLVVSANKKELLEVIQKQKKILGNLKFSNEHFSAIYNVWLAKGKPLNILKDLRKIKRGSKANLYQFKLALWSTVLKDNELEFKRAWEEGKQHKNSEYVSSSYNLISDKCPYKGLFAFDKEDVPFFFGRKKFIRTLVNAVQKQPLVAVIGNSGIGKSSVIRAGLIPELESSGAWKIAIFRPTNNPFFGLAKALLELFDPEMDTLGREINAKRYANDFKNGSLILKKILESKLQEISAKEKILIVVDQFEELYTLCLEDEINIFLDQLLGAIEIKNENPKLDVVLVITLRADFHTYALSHPVLGKALQDWKPETLLKMNPDELKEAIEEPAQIAKLKIQDGLTQIILEAVKNNQGELPSLEFTLEKLWEKRSDGQLTISAYHEIGGVKQALANHAETVYNQLNDTEKKQAQHIFTQLVRFGENTDDTRRLATLDEIGSENWGLVTKLTGVERDLKARLVITGKDSKEQPTVEVVHEALIKGWERLREWMEEDREFRKWQDRLRSEKDIWENSGRDNGALLRGALLVEAEKWLQEKSDGVTSQQEIEFILACRQHQEQQEIERIEELLTLSQKELQLKQQLSSLVIAVKAGVKLGNIQEPTDNLKRNIIERLQQASYEINEHNQFVGHQGEISDVAFSPDGLIIASVSDDCTIKLWSLDGKLLNTCRGHTDRIYKVTFSSNSQMIASASADATVKLWTLYGELLANLEGHSDWVWGVSFSPNCEIVASASSDKTVKLWTLDGELLTTLEGSEGHSDRVHGVSFSPTEAIVASASFDKTVKLWTLDGELLTTLEGHTDLVYEVNFSPNGQIVASTSSDKTVKLWTLDGKCLKTLQGHSDRVYGVSFSRDGKIIASSSSDKTVKLWTVDGKCLRTLQGHSDRVYGVSISPDGKTIASSSSDETLRLWTLSGTLLRILEGHTDRVHEVNFSSNGQIIASTSADQTVKLWTQDGRLLKTLEGHSDRVWGISFSSDGKTIASGSFDNTVKLWALDGTFLRTLEGHLDWVYEVSFSPKEAIVASASADKTIKLWTQDGRLLKTLEGHSDRVWGVSFSPDGKTIASASDDKTIKLWNRDGILRTFEGHTDRVRGVSFSPDGMIIASASDDKTIKLWNQDGASQTLAGHRDRVNGISFSPDGQMIASASDDKTVKLWNRDGILLRTFEGHTNRILGVSFSPDSKIIVSASDDKTVRLWRIDPEDLILNLDAKLNNLLQKSCNWIRNYLKTNSNVSESDRTLCDKICSSP
ncbi:hypothetical protein IQ247_15255 [Plectonema cf. radiosum LEGE 06105]|uniref:Uncharacterized protein n=1 Tax=Plectonema cf. radiosum LEGE 06105 TaxID=945769 RepID=A0A8J7K0S7_9CYAN|nr:hypothetical protein [Plectonema radiosum]MBE9214006.1 hypothetical protein [Plectonema cf. radiosum LEGE 06105]